MAQQLVGDGLLYDHLPSRSGTHLSLQHIHLSSPRRARLVAPCPTQLQPFVTLRQGTDLLLLHPITVVPLLVAFRLGHPGLAKKLEPLLDLCCFSQQLARALVGV